MSFLPGEYDEPEQGLSVPTFESFLQPRRRESQTHIGTGVRLSHLNLSPSQANRRVSSIFSSDPTDPFARALRSPQELRGTLFRPRISSSHPFVSVPIAPPTTSVSVGSPPHHAEFWSPRTSPALQRRRVAPVIEELVEEEQEISAEERPGSPHTPRNGGGGGGGSPGGPRRSHASSIGSGPAGPPGSPSGPGGPGGPGGGGPPPSPPPGGHGFAMPDWNNLPPGFISMFGEFIASQKAIAEKLVEKQKKSSKPKEPDTFDGSDPHKLRPFLSSLQIQFNDRPDSFPDGPSKINYGLSYLRGLALEYFQPDLLGSAEGEIDPPAWMFSYSAWMLELHTYFGVVEVAGDAADSLDELAMKTTDRIARYTVKFNSLAAKVGYGNNALCHAFYRGLPDRIKDEVGRMGGQPSKYLVLKQMATVIDARYWRREGEKSRQNRKTSAANKSSSNTSSNSSSHSSSSSSNTQSKSKKGKSNTQGDNKSSGSNSASTSTRPAFLDKLGKDGKLSEAEKARRTKEGLCAYCGGKHKVDDCNKRRTNMAAKEAKAKAATTSAADSTKPDDKSGK